LRTLFLVATKTLLAQGARHTSVYLGVGRRPLLKALGMINVSTSDDTTSFPEFVTVLEVGGG
jgi:hypothetical protein